MKAFLCACLAIVVIGVGMHFALDNAGFSSAEQRSGQGVRLD